MNLRREWIDGRLCEKGLMKERYDESSDSHIRRLTEEGKKFARRLLSEPEWRKFLVEEVKKMNIPIEAKRLIWLRILKFLKENEKKTL